MGRGDLYMKIHLNIRTRRFIAYLLGLAMVVCAILFINHSVGTASALFHRDVVAIVPATSSNTHIFDERTDAWADNFSGLFSAERLTSGGLRGPGLSAYAHISAVDNAYFNMVFMPFISGGPWHTDHTAIIMCRHLAWALFGAYEVAGQTVTINDVTFSVAGVVDNKIEPAEGASNHGFAWISRENMPGAGFVYLQPNVYNPLTARLEAESLLNSLNERTRDFIITDVNMYINSISLRAHILLLTLCIIIIIASACWAVHLYHLSRSRVDIGVCVTLALGIAALAIVIFTSINIEIWLPDFMGDGLDAISMLVFNTGLLSSGQILPSPLAALADINTQANAAFVVGFGGFIVLGLTKFLSKD